MIDFACVIYIAARSLEEFYVLRDKLKKINSKIEAAYWPILKKSYWVSPFSYTSELNTLLLDLAKNKENKKLKVLLDLELPFLHKRLLFRNFFSFFRNKRIIKNILINADNFDLEILTAEYPAISKFVEKVWQCFGISYSPKYGHRRGVMFYSSMIKSKYIKNKIEGFIKKEDKGRLAVGLGTITPGILGNEKLLSPERLDRDLDFLN